MNDAHSCQLEMSIVTDGLNSAFNRNENCLINVLFLYFNVKMYVERVF